MEENSEEKNKLSEKERKQEVENIARKDANKDSETATTDEIGKQVKDIDDIIAGDEVLSYGVKKLQEIGFGADYFKKLVKLQSSFSVGENEEQLIDSARNVFDALVIKITDDPNGIVLNKDGSINVRKSERQKAEIEKINDVFSKSPLLSEKKSKTIFDEVFNEIQNEKIFSNSNRNILLELDKIYGRNNNSDYNFADTNSEKEKDNFLNKAGITEEEKEEWEKLYSYTSLDNNADVEFIRDLYKIKESYLELVEAEKNNDGEASNIRTQLEQELEEIKKRSKDSKYFKETENLGLDEMMKFHDEWEHERSESQIFQKMSQLNYTEEDFETDDVKRAKILTTIARAFMHKDDNEFISKALKQFLKPLNLDVEMTLKNLMELINNTRGMPKVNNIEELYEKVVKLEEISNKTYNVKLDDIKEYVKQGKGRNSNYYNTVLNKDITTELFNLLEKSKFNMNEKSVMLMSIYKRYYTDAIENGNNGKSAVVLNVLRTFMNIPEVKRFLDTAVREDSNQISIFDSNGNIDTAKVNYILELNKEVKQRLSSEIGAYIGRINQKFNKKGKELKEQEIKEIVDSIERGDSDDNIKKRFSSLGEPAIIQLKNLNNEKINEYIDKVLNKKEVDASKFFSDEEKERLSIENKVLAIEARIRAAAGTSQYQKALKERSEYKNSKLREKFDELRKNGILSQKVEQYKDHFMYDVIDNMVNNEDLENLSDIGRKNYASILLAGLSNSHEIIREEVQQTLVLLYPDLDLQIRDQNELKKRAFKEVLGKDFSIEEIEALTNDIVNNVIISDTNKDSKVSDLEMDAFFKDKSVDLEESKDFTKSELQKKMGGLGIEFSDSDRKRYLQLKNSLLKEVCFNNKEELEYHAFIANIMSGKHDEAESLLNQNPAFSKLLDKEGNIKNKILEKEKNFQEKFILESMLDDLNQAIIDDKKMIESQKLAVMKKAMIVYEHSKTIDNPEIAEIFQKISFGALKKLEEPNRKFLKLNENNESILDEENIFNFYTGRNPSKGVSNYKDLVEKLKKDSHIEVHLKKYLLLNENDFLESEGMPEAQKMQELRSIVSFKSQQKILEGVVKRRFTFIQKRVTHLSEHELNELLENNQISNSEKEQFIAIWHYDKEDKGNYQDKITDIQNRMYDKINAEEVYSIEGINASFGNEVFSQVIEKDKKNKVTAIIDNLKNIKFVSRDRILSLDNVNANAIWYSETIKNMRSRGLVEETNALTKEFYERFGKNGKTLDEIVTEIEAKIVKVVDDRYMTNNEIDNKKIARGFLERQIGKKENDEMETYSEISKKYYDKKFFEGYKEIELLCSKSTNDSLVVLSNLYKDFSENTQTIDKYRNESCLIGLDALKEYLAKNKGQFPSIVNKDGIIDFEKLKSNVSQNAKTSQYSQNIINKIYDVATEEGRMLRDSETVFEYINSNDESNYKSRKTEGALLSLYKSGNLTDDLVKKMEKKNPDLLNGVIKEQENAKNDTILLYVKTLGTKVKRGTGEVIEVLTKKRSAKEIANKVVNNVKRGSKRLGQKLSYSMDEATKRKREKAEQKRQNKINRNLRNSNQKALESGNIDDRNSENQVEKNKMIDVNSVKAVESQNNNIWDLTENQIAEINKASQQAFQKENDRTISQTQGENMNQEEIDRLIAKMNVGTDRNDTSAGESR